eukprot:2569796-Amphidinium_carterae.1
MHGFFHDVDTCCGGRVVFLSMWLQQVSHQLLDALEQQDVDLGKRLHEHVDIDVVEIRVAVVGVHFNECSDCGSPRRELPCVCHAIKDGHTLLGRDRLQDGVVVERWHKQHNAAVGRLWREVSVVVLYQLGVLDLAVPNVL